MTQHCCWCNLVQRKTAASSNSLRIFQSLQCSNGALNDVDLVLRTHRLRQDVVDACALQHGAHWTAGDNTGTRSCWAEQDDASGGLTLDQVWNGSANAWNAEEGLLGLFNALGDSSRNFLGLTVANANQTVAVSNDHKCGESEATTTLDDLGDAVDSYNALEEFFGFATIWTSPSRSIIVVCIGVINTRLFSDLR